MRGPEHPVSQLAPGLFGRVLGQGPQWLLELLGAVELALGVRVPQRVERFGLPVGQIAGVLQYRVFDAAHALDGFLVPVAALRFDGYTDGADLWQYVIANFGTLCWVPSCSAVSSWCPRPPRRRCSRSGGAAFRGICRPSGVTSSGCPG